jgi:hypothetical protein
MPRQPPKACHRFAKHCRNLVVRKFFMERVKQQHSSIVAAKSRGTKPVLGTTAHPPPNLHQIPTKSCIGVRFAEICGE